MVLTGDAGAFGGNHSKSGPRSSDPRLNGPRDMNYDHQIVAGDRVGPVKMGGLVSETVQHLGNPTGRSAAHIAAPAILRMRSITTTKTNASSSLGGFRHRSPRLKPVMRGINVTCDRWSTPDGLHVGSSMKDVSAHIGQYCPSNRPNGSMIISTKQGIWFEAKDRNSPITIIRVMPASDNRGGMCKD